MENPTLAMAQQKVDNWIQGTRAGYFPVMTNLGILTEEVGEVARILVRQHGGQTAKPGDAGNLADELADVLWVVLCLANQTGVDINAAFLANMEKKQTRDAGRH